MLKMDMDVSYDIRLDEQTREPFRDRMEYNMTRAVLMLENSIKKVVGGAGSGRWYRQEQTVSFNTYYGQTAGGSVFSKKGRTAGKTVSYTAFKGGATAHQASAPGQPPARDFGDYVNSWAHRVTRTATEIMGEVGSRLWEKRGKWLEFGTKRMKPRPHIDQAINAVRADIERVLNDI